MLYIFFKWINDSAEISYEEYILVYNTMLERIYNPITAMGFSAMFTFQNIAGIPFAVSICTRILKYRVWKIELDELEFLSSLN